MERLLPIMSLVYETAHGREMLGKQVPNNDKIFSIRITNYKVDYKAVKDFGLHDLRYPKGDWI